MGQSWEKHEDTGTVEMFDFVLQMNYQTWMSGDIFCIVCQHFEFADPLWQNSVEDVLQDTCGYLWPLGVFCLSWWLNKLCDSLRFWSVFGTPMWDNNRPGGWRSPVLVLRIDGQTCNNHGGRKQSLCSVASVFLRHFVLKKASFHRTGWAQEGIWPICFHHPLLLAPEWPKQPRRRTSREEILQVSSELVPFSSWRFIMDGTVQTESTVFWTRHFVSRSTAKHSLPLFASPMRNGAKSWKVACTGKRSGGLNRVSHVSFIVWDQGISRLNIWTLLLE